MAEDVFIVLKYSQRRVVSLYLSHTRCGEITSPDGLPNDAISLETRGICATNTLLDTWQANATRRAT